MRRFEPGIQKRCQRLMDRHNEGQLSVRKHVELKRLVARHRDRMLLNTEALLRAISPELFMKFGQLIRGHLEGALRRCAQTGKLATK